MFDSRDRSVAAGSAAAPTVARFGSAIDAGVVRGWIAALADEPPALDDAGRIDLLRALEDLKSAASASQAWVSVAFDASQRAAQRAAGVPGERVGVGVGAQVALARRESPHAGGRWLGLARALVEEMPHALAALSSGVLSELQATVLARESACLSREDRAEFDRLVAGQAAGLVGLGTRALTVRAKTVAQRLDVAAVVARARRAEQQRCVTVRPAPDTMTYLTALLPVAQGVAVYAALTRAADSARATGDPRGRGQVMADELVARITGSPTRRTGPSWAAASPAADPAAAPGAPVAALSAAGTTGDARGIRPPVRLEVQLVMTERTLLAGDDEPAFIPGYGTVPGPWARNLVLDALTTSNEETHRPRPGGGDDASTPRDDLARPAGPLGPLQVWLRRLFTAPSTGHLVAMDSRSRLAPPGLADLIRVRDGGACRTPYCDAPARHIDHVSAAAGGGPTSAGNLQGLCESCNYWKEAPGWRHTTAPPGGSVETSSATTGVASGAPPGGTVPTNTVAPDVQITTPTGHHYVSSAPALPGTGHETVNGEERPAATDVPVTPDASELADPGGAACVRPAA